MGVSQMNANQSILADLRGKLEYAQNMAEFYRGIAHAPASRLTAGERRMRANYLGEAQRCCADIAYYRRSLAHFCKAVGLPLTDAFGF